MKKIILLCVFLLCHAHSFAQTQTTTLIEQAQAFDRTERQQLIDLLAPAIANGVFDNFQEDKLEAIRLVTNAYVQLGRLDAAESAYLKLRREAQAAGNEFYVGKSYFYEGETLSAQGKLQEALVVKQKALEIFSSTGNKIEIANMHVEISSALRVLGRYNESIEQAKEARRLSESIEDIYGIASAYNAMAMSHSHMGNYGQALEAMLQTLALDKQAGKDSELATTYYNIADIYERMNDIEMAKQYYLESLQRDLEDKHPEHLGFDYVALGNVERKQKNFDKARNYLLKAIDAFRQIDSGKNLAWTYNMLARVDLSENKDALAEEHIQLGWTELTRSNEKDDVNRIENRLLAAELALRKQQYQVAHDFLDEIEIIALAQQATGKLQEIFTLRSRIYQAQNKFQEALAAYQQYHELASKIQRESRAVTIANLQNNIDFMRQEHQIDLLEKQTALNSAQLDSAKTERNAWIAILTSFVFIIAAITYREYTKRKASAQHKQMAEELVVRKNEMLAEVSHELRNPLTALKLQIETLEYNLEDNPRAAYQKLHKKVTELNQLIDDLYQLAKADNGLMALDKEDTSLLTLLEDVSEGYDEVLQHHGLHLETDFQLQANDILQCDVHRLKQVIVNLLRNSLHYTDAPGVVKCSAEKTKEGYIIQVEDSAPGVSDDELPRLFERLYRADMGKSRDNGGSGLGLSICKTLIEAHDGKVSASVSELGGLKIVLYLPNSHDKLILEPSN